MAIGSIGRAGRPSGGSRVVASTGRRLGLGDVRGDDDAGDVLRRAGHPRARLAGGRPRRQRGAAVPAGGITACNRFVDCSSLAGARGGTLLFLAHKDGSIWIHGAVNGAHVSTVHAHGQWTNTSGHHRLLPACVARTFDGEFLYAATTDGGCVHRYAVGAPATWSRASHVRFPAAFRRRVRELVLAVHACVARGGGGGGGGGGGIDERERRFRLGVGAATTLAAGPSANGETGERGSRAPELWGEGFAAVASVEPGIVELVVARMARLEHGSESSEEPARRSAWDPREGDG